MKLLSGLAPVYKEVGAGPLRRGKHWMARARQLEEVDRNIVRGMRPDVASVLHGARIRLWEDVSKTTGYEDMEVVKECIEGSHLGGACDVTGLWPKKFAPVTMTIGELHCTAAEERELQSHWRVGVGDVGDAAVQQSVWQQTLKEGETGAHVGPINLEDVDATFPLSRRFGVQQGQKVRCVDDFTHSGVNACAQVVESPRPHTLDTIAALCMPLMAWQDLLRKNNGSLASLTPEDPTGSVRSTHFHRVSPTLLFLTLQQRPSLPSGWGHCLLAVWSQYTHFCVLFTVLGAFWWRSSWCLDEPTVGASRLHRTFISVSAPRTLDVSTSGVWFVFTDACFDPETFSGIGAVLVDSNGKLQRVFFQEIHDELLKMISVTSRKTAIFELEFFAIFCSFRVWRKCPERSLTMMEFETHWLHVRQAVWMVNLYLKLVWRLCTSLSWIFGWVVFPLIPI